MAAQVGSLYVALTADIRPFSAGMTRAQNVTKSAAATIRREAGLSQRSVESLLGSVGSKRINPAALLAVSRGFENAADRASLFRSSLLSLTAVAGGLTAALSSNLIARYVDTFINLTNQVKTVTSSQTELLAVQEALNGVASRSRSDLQSTVTIYARTARATEKLGLSQEKLLKITETVQKAFSIGGATAAEAAGAAIQLSQGIASNRLGGEEFRSVAENAPVLLRGIADSLGVDIGKLREMAGQGELTADVVTKAILGAADRIDQEFGSTAISVDRALSQIDNRLISYFGTADKAYGISRLLTSSIIAFGDNLDKIIPVLTTVAGLVGAVFLARNKGAFGGGLGALLGGGIGSALGGIQGGILGAGVGALSGFQAGSKGPSFIKKMKDDAAEAKQQVVALTETQRRLQGELAETGKQFNEAYKLQSIDQIDNASKKFTNEYQRQALVLTNLDEKRLSLNDEIRGSYEKLSNVTAQMTPRAVKLAEAQIEAQQKLRKATLARYELETDLAHKTNLETAALGMRDNPTISAKRLTAATKERKDAERDLLRAETDIANQRVRLANREITIAGLASEADKKAINQRIAAHQELDNVLAQGMQLDEERAKQVKVLADSRAKAEEDGSARVRTQIEQTGAAYRKNASDLDIVSTSLKSATRNATFAGQAFNLFKSAGSGLIAALGGPAGIAITVLTAGIGFLASSAQEARERTHALVQEMNQLGIISDEAAGKIEGVSQSLESLAADQLRNKLREIREEMNKIRNGQNFVENLFGGDETNLGNILKTLSVGINLTKAKRGSLLNPADIDGAQKLRDTIAAFTDPSSTMTLDVFYNRLDKIATLDMSANMDKLISDARQGAELYAGLAEYAERTAKALEVKPDTSWLDQMIKEQQQVADQVNSASNLRGVASGMLDEASMTEEESRLADVTDKIMKAWQTINEEKGLSVNISRSAAEAEAARIIAAEDAKKAEEERQAAATKSNAETLKFMQELQGLQNELNARAANPIDKNVAGEVQQLISDFKLGVIGADELVSRLDAIAGKDVSSGMQQLINKIAAAIPGVAALVGLMNMLPGSGGGVTGQPTGPTMGRGALGEQRRKVAEMQAVTDAYADEQLRLAGLTEDQAALEAKTKELMTNIPTNGIALTESQAGTLAAQILAAQKNADALSGGGGGGGKNSESAYDKAIKSLQEKTLATQTDTDTVNGNTYAIEKARAMLDLENAAKEDGIGLSAERVAMIEKEASAYALAAAAQEEQKKKSEEAAASLAFYKDTFSSFLTDIAGSLRDGATLWDAFADAASNALSRIADRALSMAADGIFDAIFGAFTGSISSGAAIPSGGFIPGITGPKLAGGGWIDGYGTGRSDSNPTMLSDGEFVVNAASAKKYAGLLESINGGKLPMMADGGFVQGAGVSTPSVAGAAKSVRSAGMTSVYAPKIDNRGADIAAVARLAQVLAKDKASFESRVVQTIRKAKASNVKF